MTNTLCPMPKAQFFDAAGVALAGGRLYTYAAGLPGTPKATYTDVSGGTANANPVVLNSAGRADIWLDGFYYMELWTGVKTAPGSTLVWTQDNMSAEAFEDITCATLTATGAIAGASLTVIGAIAGASASVTGDVATTTLTATGAIAGASVTALGAVLGGTITSLGAVSGASLTTTGTVTATSGATIGTSGATITRHLSGTAVWDPGSVADGAVTNTTVTVTGAAVGNPVAVGFSTAVPANAMLSGSVTATNTVTVTLFNKTGAPLDLASGTLRASVWQY